MSVPMTWWFPIEELRAAVNEVADRYPNAEVGRSPVGNIVFTVETDDEGLRVIRGDIDLGPQGVERVDYWDDDDEEAVEAG